MEDGNGKHMGWGWGRRPNDGNRIGIWDCDCESGREGCMGGK